jgi:hypothetical protein
MTIIAGFCGKWNKPFGESIVIKGETLFMSSQKSDRWKQYSLQAEAA